MKENTFGKRCEELDNIVNELSDSEKKFVLWELLDYYRDGLLSDIQFTPKDAADIRAMQTMKRHIDACKEMREVITEEIF